MCSIVSCDTGDSFKWVQYTIYSFIGSYLAFHHAVGSKLATRVNLLPILVKYKQNNTRRQQLLSHYFTASYITA